MSHVRTIIATTALLLSAAQGVCKCVNRFIYIDARIVGPLDSHLHVKATVAPDPNWEPQPELVVRNDEVSGKIYFNTTKSEGRARDNCSRVPKTVNIILFQGEHQVDQVQLEIAKDFVRTELRDYRPRKVITLHTQPTGRRVPHPLRRARRWFLRAEQRVGSRSSAFSM